MKSWLEKEEAWLPLIQNGELFSRYKVSNYGVVWDIKNATEVSQVLTGKPTYKYVNLYKDNGKRVLRRVNNIISWTFHGAPPSPKHTSDHIDQDRFNNVEWNLRWADTKEQSVNRDITIICEDGETLVSKIEKYCQESGEDYSCVYSTLSNNYKTYGDFEECVKYRKHYLKYGRGWSYTVEAENGIKFKLSDLCEERGLDFFITKQAILDGVPLEYALIGCTIPLRERNYPNSTEFNNHWYCSKEHLVKSEGNCTMVVFNYRLKQGLTIEEALVYDDKEKHRFYIDGVFMTQKEHCERLCVSHDRISAYMTKHNLSFEEAIKIPVQRIIKHNINGVTKRNSDWFSSFNIPPKTANSWMSKSKERDLRTTLEHYGIDTSGMEIYPCDGEVVMYNNPI